MGGWCGFIFSTQSYVTLLQNKSKSFPFGLAAVDRDQSLSINSSLAYKFKVLQGKFGICLVHSCPGCISFRNLGITFLPWCHRHHKKEIIAMVSAKSKQDHFLSWLWVCYFIKLVLFKIFVKFECIWASDQSLQWIFLLVEHFIILMIWPKFCEWHFCERLRECEGNSSEQVSI